MPAGFVYALEVNYPPIPGAAPPTDFPSFAKYIVYFSMWAGGVIALFMFVIGGIRYVLSTGNPERMVNAKNQIIGSLLGLLIILSSFIILNTINPQLTNLSMEPLSSIDIQAPPEVKEPEITSIQSSIDPESSPSRIIEKMFEVYISEYPEPDETWIPRVIRLKNRAVASQEIVERIYALNKDLRSASRDCECEETEVEKGQECPQYFNNPWECSVDILYECTGDACKKVRDDIQDLEEKIINEIYLGKGVMVSNQMTENWTLETHNTTLMKEIVKAEEEVALLKEQLDRLRRSEKFIQDCPLRSLHSLIQLLDRADDIENQGGVLREIDFWNDVDIVFSRPLLINARYWPIPYTQTETLRDYATFYCDVSGSLEQFLATEFAPDENLLTGEESVEEAEEVFSESLACSSEVPLGELSEKAKRTTELLIEKFETIIDLEKELIDRFDKMEQAISKCSAKKCLHPCIWIPPTPISLPICLELWCQEQPCPRDEIDDQYSRIQQIRDQIDLLVNGAEPYDTAENIGIIRLLDTHIPVILEELEKTIRIPMKECSYEATGTSKYLINCYQALGALVPSGRIVTECGVTEKIVNGQIQDTTYGQCFEECYLETSQKDYRICLNDCLIRKGEELNDSDLPHLMHSLNFYCCNVGD